MKQYLIIILALSCVPLSSTTAQKSVEFSVSPSVGHSFGKTEYILEVQSAFVDEDDEIITDEFGNTVIFHVKSQLEYPLDVVMGGVNLRINSADDPDLWSVEAGIFTSLSDPGGTMKDSDWDGASGIYDFTQWSYTESSAKMNSFMLDIRGTRRLFRPEKFSVSLVAGLRYHRIEQELYGVNGWQRPFNDAILAYDEPQFFAVLQDTLVLYYKVKYLMPQIGLRSRIDLRSDLTVGLETILSPVWFSDVDDHILRNKLSKADGWGLGIIGAFNARKRFGSSGSQAAPYIDLFAEVTTISASGDQTQNWYGDDPFTPDDDTDIVFPGIPHDINATLFHAGIRLGLIF
ncbi:MAG: omptin family outer membrane protease [Candidatus Zixiibacteriota bacterium]|nr:MAG: omptin family outer membrane protease [candidate division Zixibacteria bacterium]